MTSLFPAILSRRGLIATTGAIALGGIREAQAQVATPDASPIAPILDELVIDVSDPPDHLTPALTYSVRDWSILHSVYDGLLDFGPGGDLQPQAAETFETDDAITFRIKLREGMTFHDGSPVTSSAISRSVRMLQEADSQIAELFDVIEEVREIDTLHAEIMCSEPSAWLPSQIAVWLVMIPEGVTEESLATAPVGSGPYVFEEWAQGNAITLRHNPDYLTNGPKGTALAERVVYRFVPEPVTRVADLTTGRAHLVADLPQDLVAEVESSGHSVITTPILGTAFVRLATAGQFANPLICQATNLAVDVQAIADALNGDGSERLASVYPDQRGLGFDPELQPFAYDPDRARELLAEAGYADGFDTEIEVVAGSRLDVIEALVASLADVGIRASIVTTELAAFNQGWPSDEAPAMRYATWRPMYDPFTFLRLVILSEGYLSRYDNPVADELINHAAVEPNGDAREALYQELGRELQEHPAAIYLWNLTTTYGVSADITTWSPRGDEYVVPVQGGNV